MGGYSASSNLYLGIDLADIFVLKTESEEYDLHDPRTGKKTGKKGKDSKVFFINKHTGERYPNDVYELPIEESYRHQIACESEDYILGVSVGHIGMYDTCFKDITPKMIEQARKKFDEIVGPHLGDKKVEPRLILNLYHSY